MPAVSYVMGQLVHITAAFAISGVATDPTAVTLTIKDPAGAVTTPTPIKDSAGNYHYDQTAALAGTYWYTWSGTGACQAAAQSTFDVSGGHIS